MKGIQTISVPFLLLALTLKATSVLARNCTPGLAYCGKDLLGIGDYQGRIDQCLADAGQPEADGGADDLFYCPGGSDGIIKFIKYCDNGCTPQGTGLDDYCN
ncbi:hypothetical protein NHQ30_006095 [Ciborinia camelliae]|nr:hypothetical protein NHQ30_006095 [Ciborinia camelliae]